MRKKIAFLLSLVMVLTSLPLSAFAAVNYTYSTAEEHVKDGMEKPTYSLVYMKYTGTYNDAKDGSDYYIADADGNEPDGKTQIVQETTIPAGGLKAGDEFLLGLKLTNLKNLKVVDETKLLNVSNVMVNFDSTYLETETAVAMSDLLATRMGGAARGGENRALYGSYELDASGVTSNAVVFKFKASNAQSTPVDASAGYPNSSVGDSIIVGLIKVKVKSDVTIPDAGVPNAITFADGNTAINFGANGSGLALSYYAEGNENYAATTNMMKVFNFDDSGIDIFPVSYPVKFDLNYDGAVNSIDDIYVSDNGTIGDSMPADPTREDGYVFTGWSTKAVGDDASKVDKDTKITADMLNSKSSDDKEANDTITLYAQWQEGYALTFDPNGGQWGDGDDAIKDAQTVYGTAKGNADLTSLPAAELQKKVTIDGTEKTYKFDGWASADGTITGADFAEVAADVDTTTTVYAQWTVADEDLDEAVLVTLHPNYGNFTGKTTDEVKTVTVFVGDTLGANYPAADSVERTDYTLNTDKSWNSAQNGTGTAVKADTAITVGDGGIATEVAPAVTGAAKYAATLYAQWTADPANKATVTFDKNNTDEGSTDADPKTIEVTKGTAIGVGNEPNEPTRTGYEFKFWGTTAEATVAYEFSTNVDDDMTLYAIWEEAAAMTVKFDAGIGTFTTQPADLTNVANNYVITTGDMNDAVANLTAPEGYVFQQWNTQANGSGTEIVADTTALITEMAVVGDDGSKTITIYAIFEADTDQPYYTVTFDKNGADKDVNPQTITVPATNEETIAALPDIPERENYKNDGKWYTDPVGGDEFVAGTTKVTEDITLYPHWTTDEDHWTVTFWGNDSADNDGKGTKLGAVEVVKGDKLTMATPTATRAGYESVRWEDTEKNIYVSANGKEEYTYGDVLAGRTTNMTGFNEFEITSDIDFFMVWGVTPTVTLKMVDGTAWDEQVYNKAAHTVAVDTTKGSDGTTEITLENATIKYTAKDVADATATETAPINAGDYDITVTFGDQSGNHPVEVCNTTKVDGVDKDGVAIDGNSTLTIKPYGLTLTLAQIDGADQQQEVNYAKDTTHDLVFSVVEDGIPEALKEEAKALTFTNKYYAVGDTALTEQTTAPSEIGLYAVVPTLGSDVTNYTIKGYETKVAVVEAEKLPDDTENADLYAKLEIKNAASLTGIAVNYGTDGTWTAADLFASESTVGTADKITFAEETKDYYTQIPFGKDTQFVLTGTLPAGVVTVKLNDVAVSLDDASKVTVADGTYTFDTKTIEKALTDTTNGDFSNMLVISWGDDTTYTVYLRQLVEAKITLNAGNSPYGEIMKDDTVWKTYTFTDENAEYNTKSDEEKKAKWQALAKASFTANNMFVDEALTPASMTSQRTNEIKYAQTAWLSKTEFSDTSEVGKALRVDPTRNMDMNEEAIFVYNKEAFVDPGFVATDSTGKAVEVKREITVKRLVDTSITYESLVDSNVADDTITITSDDANYLVEELKTGNYIRPDVYEMKYSFVDGDETVSVVRKVVVLSKAGDADTDNEVGVNDLIYINKFVASGGEVTDSLSGFVRGTNIADSAYRVFSYRVMDSFYDGEIDTNDLIAINKFAAAGGEGVATPLPVFYAKLPSAK